MNLQGYKIQVAIIASNPYSILIYKNKDDELYDIWGTHLFLSKELYLTINDICMFGYLTINEDCIYAATVKYTSKERRELMLNEFTHLERACSTKVVELYEQILNNYLFEVE
jgi:hypothetical protein